MRNQLAGTVKVLLLSGGFLGGLWLLQTLVQK